MDQSSTMARGRYDQLLIRPQEVAAQQTFQLTHHLLSTNKKGHRNGTQTPRHWSRLLTQIKVIIKIKERCQVPQRFCVDALV